MEQEVNPDWKRLEAVIEVSGTSSVNAMAKRLGLKRAENLYQIKKGNNKISKKLAQRIHELFPQFSVSWLAFGTEQEDPSESIRQIPYYTMDSGNLHLTDRKASYVITLSGPVADGFDCIITMPDNGLCADIPKGSLVFLRKVKPMFQEDRFYLVETTKLAAIGKIEPITDSDYILKPSEVNQTSPIRLRKEDLRAVYEVFRILIDLTKTSV